MRKETIKENKKKIMKAAKMFGECLFDPDIPDKYRFEYHLGYCCEGFFYEIEEAIILEK